MLDTTYFNRVEVPLSGRNTVRPWLPKPAQIRLWKLSNGHCWYCGIALVFAAGVSADSGEFTVDHVEPSQRKTTPLVPACRPCNSQKGAKGLEAYRAAHGGAGHQFWFEHKGLPLPPERQRSQRMHPVALTKSQRRRMRARHPLAMHKQPENELARKLDEIQRGFDQLEEERGAHRELLHNALRKKLSAVQEEIEQLQASLVEESNRLMLDPAWPGRPAGGPHAT